MFKKIIPILAIAVVSIPFSSCKKKGCTDEKAINYNESSKKEDGSCTYHPQITLSFSHNFGGTNVSSANFDKMDFTNENGEQMSFTKLRYSISDVRFFLSSGDSVLLDGYHLVDLKDQTTLEYLLPEYLKADTYTGIAFNFGFTEADNTSGAYTDLNEASWSWPSMLGGGYHQMQLEGRFIETGGSTLSYQFHMGSRIRKIVDDVTTFHPNYLYVPLANSDFTLSKDAKIELKMDIAEWFKSPNTWDLNTYYKLLMSNYDAQIMMQENGPTVFSLGAITQ